ncbi:UDP-N-acetylmuramoyl-L-alanine--D-glutamate ligase, partial [Candidatus Peribacteria bacterium]|nr:UDP-N-acetylmuramoyl-L-alanine--D-glutamate ligase [Candidatus Peribacteria bacterium]
MHIRELAGKHLCILGYGREGVATAKALLQYAKGCSIVIADENPAAELRSPEIRTFGDIGFQTGPSYLQHLDRFDVLIKSPGIPPSELPAKLPPVTTPTQIFLDTIKESGATVIGVTGSKGKSTVSSLLHAILKAAGKRSFLVGNIGEPAISHIDDANLNTFFVQEMSSYQLMDLASSPQIAVITSFFPEHLDYHENFENYFEAKKHITRFQSKNNVVFFNADSEGAKKIADESKGKKIPFSAGNAPVTLEEIQLKGQHNLGNIAAAYKVAMHLGIEPGIAVAAIKRFKGLPHRLESLGIVDGIEWINDSISTTPESAIAALDALGERVSTIILGGQDRGYDFSPLVKRLQTSSVKTVI